MRVLAALCVVVAAALVAAAGDATAAQKRAGAPLKAFGSCTELVRYARGNVLRIVRQKRIPPWTDGGGQDDSVEPLRGGAERGGGLDDGFSTTNVQEPGVDEPDLVKTDGSRLYAVAGSRLEVTDIRGPQPVALGQLDLGRASAHELLLLGDRLLVVSSQERRTVAREVDVSDPAAMTVVRSLAMEGSYVTARMRDGSVRLVTATWPRAMSSLRRVRRAGRSAAWLPRATVRRAPGARPQRRKLVDCRSVRRTANVTGLEVVTVVTLGLQNGLQQLDADALMTGSETVYASPRSLYVGSYDAGSGRTGLHRFDTSDPANTEYTASGSVPGHLLDEWALSEHAGHLRVASTTGSGDKSESRITVLREEPDGRLGPVGLVSGLGRTESITGVRFEGDVGYVVTFRQIDPLYTVDLAEPANPRVLGELKIPGYSDYLHPVGPGRLLGIGQDATFDGDARGTQVSLFDVSDLRAPLRLSNLVLGSRYRSPVEEEHRAFLFWPPTGLVVLPIDRWREATTRLWAGIAAFRVSPSGLTEITRIAHPGEPFIHRSLVSGERLLTVSEEGVMSSALATGGDGRWLAFD